MAKKVELDPTQKDLLENTWKRNRTTIEHQRAINQQRLLAHKKRRLASDNQLAATEIEEYLSHKNDDDGGQTSPKDIAYRRLERLKTLVLGAASFVYDEQKKGAALPEQDLVQKKAGLHITIGFTEQNFLDNLINCVASQDILKAIGDTEINQLLHLDTLVKAILEAAEIFVTTSSPLGSATAWRIIETVLNSALSPILTAAAKLENIETGGIKQYIEDAIEKSGIDTEDIKTVAIRTARDIIYRNLDPILPDAENKNSSWWMASNLIHDSEEE